MTTEDTQNRPSLAVLGTVALGLLGVLAIAITANRLASDAHERSAEGAARSYSAALTAVRDRYIQDIVQSAVVQHMTPDEKQHFTYGSFPVAYELLNEVSEDLAGSERGRFRIYSDFPWPSRENGGPRTTTEVEILRAILDGREASVVREERRGSERWLVFAEPVVMREFCVDCHNDHVQSPKRGWKAGDVRGVQLVEVALPAVPLLPTEATWSSLGTIVAFSGLTLMLCGGLLSRVQRGQQTARRGRLFHDLLHRAGDPMISIDEEGRVTTFNLAAEELLGYGEAEVLGRSATVFMDAKDAPRHEAGFRAAIARGRARSAEPAEVEAVTRDGERIPVGMVVAVVDGPEGKRVIGTLRDLRTTKRLEARVRSAETAEAIGQLTAGIAHDFNNMLMVIGANAEVVREDLEGRIDPQPLTDMVEAVEQAAQLTNHLLTVTGQQRLSPQPVWLDQELPRMVKLLRRTLGTSIRIELSLGNDSEAVRVDPGLFEAAVINLAINARDAMPGGGNLSIRVDRVEGAVPFEASHEAGFVRLTFSDTGQGIPREHLERVFEPFFSTKETSRSRGLGLSMVRGFARQSGGEVELESSAEGGTSIFLFLPRAAEEAALEGDEAPPINVAGTSVLVVEDEAPVREALVRILDRLGVKSSEVHNADEALARLTLGDRPEVVLTDVLMPGALDGHQLALEIERRFPEVGVVVVSGYNAHPEWPASVPHLRKPVRSEELAAAIDEARRSPAGPSVADESSLV